MYICFTMNLIKKHIIGVMSGTSLDGIDIAYITIQKAKKYSFTIHKAETVSYCEETKNRLKEAFVCSGEKLQEIDAWYGSFLGKKIQNFIQKNKIDTVDFIASHGHTIFHNPEKGYTLQIGNGAQITAITGIKTICDFRKQDIALGGQGAPLVPIGDRLLFSEYEYCLNIGGFANVSFEKKDTQRAAFDICPANIVLNHYVNQLGLNYDDEGNIASTGSIHQPLLKELNDLPYYKDEMPKSLGYEYVKEIVFPIIDAYHLEVKDILKTFVEHIAIQIAAKIKKSSSLERMLITGGGAYNNFLIQRIRKNATVDCVVPKNVIIDYKEALIFALLGFLKETHQVNCLKSVTGAIKNHSSGIVFEI